MSKHIRVKLTCEIAFDLADLNYVSAEHIADAIREAEGLDPFDAIDDDMIIRYVEAQDVYQMNDEFGIVDAEIQEVIIE
jgi:hypothetical protein